MMGATVKERDKELVGRWEGYVVSEQSWTTV
jgi:hypothetical protein